MSLNINWSGFIKSMCDNMDKNRVVIMSKSDGTGVITFPFCEATYAEDVSANASRIPGNSLLAVTVNHQKAGVATVISVSISLDRPGDVVCLCVRCSLAGEGVDGDMETIFKQIFQMFEKSHDAGMCSNTPYMPEIPNLVLTIDHKIQKDVPDSIHVDRYIFLTFEELKSGPKPGKTMSSSFEKAVHDARQTTSDQLFL